MMRTGTMIDTMVRMERPSAAKIDVTTGGMTGAMIAVVRKARGATVIERSGPMRSSPRA
ncbi:hypothetical protein GCM10028811_02280 [Uliginosibacterium sediminicola]